MKCLRTWGKRPARLALSLWCVVSFGQTKTDPLDGLASDFWTWRAEYRPFSSDDVPRMEHKPGVRDWSPATIAKQQADLAQFERRWKALRTAGWPVARMVDYRLLGSALARVRWELDVNPRWQRDPMFYVEQTVVALQEELMPPPPLDAARSREIVARAENIPSILEQAKVNLKAVAPFAQLSIAALSDIDARLARVERGVSPLLAGEDQRRRFQTAIANASKALIAYREWLKQRLPNMRKDFALGDKAYGFFLQQVALLPYTPDQLLSMARQDFERVLSMESYEHQRDLRAPELKLAATAEEEAARMAREDANIRRYLTEHQILTVPPDLPHWALRPAPDYIAAFEGFAEIDDFAGPSRLHQDGTRWIHPPSNDLGFFWKAYAQDPRTTGVHEGVPGHFFQLSLSRRNPDAIRRQYYDSSANEGIGFYAEEMMLAAGLFDDSPRTREIIYTFARLRALRVEVDVKLSLGRFSIPQAADYLTRTVPLDRGTAEGEAAGFATAPGLGIAYEVGKLQIERMLADRRLQLGGKFTLRDFHDYVWSNGNVPLSLQRWELLGLDDDVKKLDELSK
ncbi:MAG TPA: DUF885 domain-containing protein [Bryobacteraceae bacterium]|nr:DUF885 domain-containing protein [Bryobacteraceae bacterium]